MPPLTLREAIQQILRTQPELQMLLAASLTSLAPCQETAAETIPEFLRPARLPPRPTVMDGWVTLLKPHRPNPPAFVDPLPSPGINFGALDRPLPADTDLDSLRERVVASFRRGLDDGCSFLVGAYMDGSLELWEASLIERDAINAGVPPTNPLPTIWYHGGESYSIGGVSQLVVGKEEHYILQAFLQHQRAMKTSEIETTAGVTNAPRSIKELVEGYGHCFAPAIRRPNGVKGAGGYFIRVQRA